MTYERIYNKMIFAVSALAAISLLLGDGMHDEELCSQPDDSNY